MVAKAGQVNAEQCAAQRDLGSHPKRSGADPRDKPDYRVLRRASQPAQAERWAERARSTPTADFAQSLPPRALPS